MRVAFATCSALPDGWPDDVLLAEAIGAAGVTVTFAVWDDPGVDWPAFDRVLVRSTWDYTDRRDEFLAWADSIGDRLRNPPALLRWNSDKRYLAELAAAALPVVPTVFVGPGERPPALEDEVVIKPVVSAGARDTGRFGFRTHHAAEELLRRIGAEGRVAMVQPYLDAVDEVGETAIVFAAGKPSHVLRKRAVLAPDEEAPVREGDPVGAAEVMYDDDLVGPGEAADAEHDLAAGVVDWLRQRFGSTPLYARVDLLRDGSGDPVLVELEAVEPCLYLATADGAAERFAGAVLDDLRSLG